MVKGDVMWPLDMAHSISQDKELCGTKYLFVINIFNILFTRVDNQY